jgi:hypothetical protein
MPDGKKVARASPTRGFASGSRSSFLAAIRLSQASPAA